MRFGFERLKSVYSLIELWKADHEDELEMFRTAMKRNSAWSGLFHTRETFIDWSVYKHHLLEALYKMFKYRLMYRHEFKTEFVV